MAHWTGEDSELYLGFPSIEESEKALERHGRDGVTLRMSFCVSGEFPINMDQWAEVAHVGVRLHEIGSRGTGKQPAKGSKDEVLMDLTKLNLWEKDRALHIYPL